METAASAPDADGEAGDDSPDEDEGPVEVDVFSSTSEVVLALREQYGLGEQHAEVPTPLHLMLPFWSRARAFCDKATWARFHANAPETGSRARKVQLVRAIHEMVVRFDRDLLSGLASADPKQRERLELYNALTDSTQAKTNFTVLMKIMLCAVDDRLVWALFGDGASEEDSRPLLKPLYDASEEKLTEGPLKVKELMDNWTDTLAEFARNHLHLYNESVTRATEAPRGPNMLQIAETDGQGQEGASLTAEGQNPSADPSELLVVPLEDTSAVVDSLIRTETRTASQVNAHRVQANFLEAALAVIALSEVSFCIHPCLSASLCST